MMGCTSLASLTLIRNTNQEPKAMSGQWRIPTTPNCVPYTVATIELPSYHVGPKRAEYDELPRVRTSMPHNPMPNPVMQTSQETSCGHFFL